MVDYNIEFAHIYSDKKFGREQEKSIEILKRKIIKFLKGNYTFSSCVLIDEYNPEKNTLKINSFLQELDKRSIFPHFIGFESKLTSKKYFLLGHIRSKKVRNEYERYINKNNHIPCSFLVVIWYLYRLGHIQLEKGIYRCYKHLNSFQGKKLINILPRKYETVEKKAMKILDTTVFAKYVKDIETIFFD